MLLIVVFNTHNTNLTVFQCGTIVPLIEGHSHQKATPLIISLISGVLDSKILQNCPTSIFNPYQAILFYCIRGSLISRRLLYIKTDSMVYIRLGWVHILSVVYHEFFLFWDKPNTIKLVFIERKIKR